MFVHNVTFQNNLRYRTWAEIDLAAMKQNLEYAKKISGKPVMYTERVLWMAITAIQQQ